MILTPWSFLKIISIKKLALFREKVLIDPTMYSKINLILNINLKYIPWALTLMKLENYLLIFPAFVLVLIFLFLQIFKLYFQVRHSKNRSFLSGNNKIK